MMDTVDNGHDRVRTVKWIMVLLYALSTIILLSQLESCLWRIFKPAACFYADKRP